MGCGNGSWAATHVGCSTWARPRRAPIRRRRRRYPRRGRGSPDACRRSRSPPTVARPATSPVPARNAGTNPGGRDRSRWRTTRDPVTTWPRLRPARPTSRTRFTNQNAPIAMRISRESRQASRSEPGWVAPNAAAMPVMMTTGAIASITRPRPRVNQPAMRQRAEESVRTDPDRRVNTVTVSGRADELLAIPEPPSAGGVAGNLIPALGQTHGRSPAFFAVRIGAAARRVDRVGPHDGPNGPCHVPRARHPWVHRVRAGRVPIVWPWSALRSRLRRCSTPAGIPIRRVATRRATGTVASGRATSPTTAPRVRIPSCGRASISGGSARPSSSRCGGW